MNPAQQNTIQVVPIALLRHSLVTPRAKFDQKKLERLAASLKTTNGPLEPLTVRPHRESGVVVYEVVRGERRLRASKLAQLTELPVEIRELSDAQAKRLALIDALERERLSDLEQIEAVMNLMCFELALNQGDVVRLLNRMHNCQQKHKSLDYILEGYEGGATLAERVEIVIKIFDEIGSTWRSYLTHALPLLGLPSDVLEGLRTDVLPNKTVAKQLAQVECLEQRATLMEGVKTQKWSTRQLQEQINTALGQTNPATPYAQRLRAIAARIEKTPDILQEIESLLDKKLTHLENLISR
ncbi:MAG: hypothetical protein RLZZ156_490 [Deinococcota bacterium]|jgi:ParB family transcriptional regulator, chromosome partitioning protein